MNLSYITALIAMMGLTKGYRVFHEHLRIGKWSFCTILLLVTIYLMSVFWRNYDVTIFVMLEMTASKLVALYVFFAGLINIDRVLKRLDRYMHQLDNFELQYMIDQREQQLCPEAIDCYDFCNELCREAHSRV